MEKKISYSKLLQWIDKNYPTEEEYARKPYPASKELDIKAMLLDSLIDFCRKEK